MKKAVISVLGTDGPGIIATVTDVFYQLDCNIENVSQTILQTEFSGIFIIGMDQGLAEAVLEGHLRHALADRNMTVHVKHLPEAGPAECPACDPFVITTRGPDQKGLVARITRIIADFGVNVTNLQAVFKGGDDPEANIMIYEVDIPATTDTQSLRRALRDKAAELALTISIQHKQVFEAINRI
jgi:glycine cleavage system transcriptional repressor